MLLNITKINISILKSNYIIKIITRTTFNTNFNLSLLSRFIFSTAINLRKPVDIICYFNKK